MRTTSFDFEAIGTHWRIDIPRDTDAKKRRLLLEKTVALIEGFDKTYSRFRDDSLVMKMARRKGTYVLPENAGKMVDLYKTLYDLTGGLFTPLVGNLLEGAGYDRNYSLVPKKLRTPPVWEEAIEYRHPKMTMKKAEILDFGAGGKGYLIDLVSDLLAKEGVRYFCVEAGGDMFFRNTGKEKLRVGLEHPDDPTKVIGVAEISDLSLCASAGNRRKWGRFHHIVDPKTLSSPSAIKATWVAADCALLADSLATALFFVEPEKLGEKFDFSYTIVKADNSSEVSADFPAKMFSGRRTS
ncbi:MAG TPA: FAD:protein FMN transferase [Candidatus Sulfotelmatobacter sp.]|nr:FAD:protein FMN transferase [Candidatus Sulfotelmatobacter sp.]